MKRLAVLLLLLLFGGSAHAFPSGAPSTACSSLTPNHGESPQSSSSPYSLDLSIFDLYSDGNYYYEPGQIYQLTLSGGGTSFRGFLLQARLMVDNTALTGSFSNPVSDSQLSSCSPPAAGLTHTSSSSKMSVTGTWTAPALGTGPIRFRYAVVQTMPIYWADIMTDVIYESGTNLVFQGSSVANNTLLVRGNVGEGENGMTCTSENANCCSDSDTSGSWFSPNGDPLHEGENGATSLYLTRGPGFVRLNRITGGSSALYWCDVPDYSGALQRFYVGLYTESLASGAFESVEVIFELGTELTEEQPEFSLTCISEGGPATNVVWRREGAEIEDDSSHSSSQIVVDTVDAVYHNILVVTGRNGGEYTCTVSHARTTIIGSIQVEVGTEATNLTSVQEDISGTSIIITWDLPSFPTVSGFTLIYETSNSSNTFSTGLTQRSLTLTQGLTTGSTYSISIITESTHLPSGVVGPVNVTLATGCVGLGYSDGCCVDSGGEGSSCTLDLAGSEEDCDCSEQCYTLGNCCPDILLSCPPPPDADLCVLFRGYECHENAECVSVSGVTNDSSSYQCVCNEGYVGDGNITCLGDTVNVSHPVVLATNGSSAVVTCEAEFFPDSLHYWVLVGDTMNETATTGKTLELDQILFVAAGDKYQCIATTLFGNIDSELVEIIVSPEGGLSIQPAVVSAERGNSVTITCTTLGGPTNTFSWVQPPSNTLLASEASLTVSVSTGQDGGVYRCSARNKAGNDSTNAIINVAVAFDQSPASVTAEVGSNVSLKCLAEGYPPPTSIQWLHYNTTVIRETDNITISEETVNSSAVVSTLELSSLKTVQYGQYHCRASGDLNSEPATISFTGNVSVSYCEELHNVTSNVTEVSSTGTVCFQCLGPDPVVVWSINDSQTVTSSIGATTPEGVLVVFLAAPVFSVDSPTSLRCFSLEVLIAETFVTLQGLPLPEVEITASSNESTVGESLTLTCSVTTTVNSLTSPPVVEFLGPSGDPVVAGGGTPTTSGAVTTLQVEFQPLTTSDGGQYTCRATINSPGIQDISSEAYITITVGLPEPVVALASVGNGSSVPYAGVVYRLECGVGSNEAYMGTGAEAAIIWRDSEGNPIISDSRVSVSETEVAPDEGGFRSTLSFSPLSLSDTGDYVCSVVVAPHPSWSFVTPSNPGELTYTVNVTAPPLPVLTVSLNGTGVAGEPLDVVCVSQFLQDLVVPPSVVLLDPLGAELEEELLTLSLGEGNVSVSALFDPLLTSHAGVLTCVSTYNISEAGLDNDELYSTAQSITLNVSIPAPQVILALQVQNATYIGTVASLYCTVVLDSAVNTPVQVTTSIAASTSNNFTLANKLANNIYQSILVFSPLTSEDGNEYVCSAKVDSTNGYITRATGQAVYTLVPLDTPEPLVTISLEEPAAVLGTDASLVCRVTTVPGLFHPPTIEWEELPDTANTTVGQMEGEGNVFSRSLYFIPTLQEHGGYYTCSATLAFPNTTIDSVSASENFTLVVQAPVPEIDITQDPEGDVIVDSAVSLICNASIPQPNSLTFSVTITWTNTATMSTVGNSSDARVLVSPSVQTTQHEFVSRLSLSAVSAELDSVYNCSAQSSVEGSGEFVSTQSATRTVSLVIVGPPADFVLESRTQISLLFSWGLSLTPGTIVGYLLECFTEVTGLGDPPPVNTTEQTATVPSLSPGVLYTCTLSPLTLSNMPPPATTNATTLESAPTGPPVGLNAEPVGARNILFTWQPPEPHLQNGVITDYIIACTPNPLSLTTEAERFTLDGLSPLTSYNCSVRANNSAGSGPPAYISITTDDDSVLIQVKVLGVGDCVSWKAQDKDAKVADLTSAIVDNTNKRCDCSITSDSIADGVFQCFGSVSDSATFRGTLRGTTSVTSSALASHIADWVATGQTILLQNVHFKLDSECQDEVVIDDLVSPECAPTMTSQGGSSSRLLPISTEAGVGVIAGALVVVGLIVLMVVACVCWRRHRLIKVNVRRKTSTADTTEKGRMELLQSYRKSTTSADSELIYNEQYSSFTQKQQQMEKPADSLTDNPLYSNPVVTSTKLDEPLPPLPEVDSDGYAAVLPLTKKNRAMTSPADYLKPVLSPQNTKETLLPPPDNSTIFENRSSGIYEDPDYTPTPKRRSASLSHKATSGTTSGTPSGGGSPARSMGRADTFVGRGGRRIRGAASAGSKRETSQGEDSDGNKYVVNGAGRVKQTSGSATGIVAGEYEEPTLRSTKWTLM